MSIRERREREEGEREKGMEGEREKRRGDTERYIIELCIIAV